MGVRIEKVYLYPLGGISKFDMPLNIKIEKEFFILIMGPIFQFIAYYLLEILFSSRTDIIRVYHYSILYFNLLPIYPLDGGRLVKLFFDKVIPYKYSLKSIIGISYFFVGILFFISCEKKFNICFMCVFLFFLIYKEHKKIDYIYHKLLLERFLKNYYFKKSVIIHNSDNFYRNRRHIIEENGKYYLENEFFAKKYGKNTKKY